MMVWKFQSDFYGGYERRIHWKINKFFHKKFPSNEFQFYYFMWPIFPLINTRRPSLWKIYGSLTIFLENPAKFE
jgi:hypothetical protein